MNCPDVRECLSDLIDGALEPDVRAQVDAHLAGCADCRRELERLGAVVSLLRAVERPQAPVGFAARVLAAARPDPWHRRLRDRLAAIRLLRFPVEAAAMVLVASLAVYVFQETPALRRAAWFETAAERSADGTVSTAAPPAEPDSRLTPAVGPPLPLSKSPRAAAPPPLPPSQPTTVFSARAPLAEQGPAQPSPAAERQKALNRALTSGGSESPASLPSAAMAPTRSRDTSPAPVAESEAPSSSGAESRIQSFTKGSAASEDRAAERSEGQSSSAPVVEQYTSLADGMTRQKDQERPEHAAPVPFTRTLPSAPPAMRLAPSPRVLGRLTVKDRQAASRELRDLLSRVGGAEMSRRSNTGGDTVNLVIPRAAYPAFAQGLERIGSWQPVGEPSDLPDQVSVTLSITQ